MLEETTPIKSVLFVCMGNICRSPAGENVMRKLLQDAGLDEEVFCDSAGTIGYHEGNPPDHRMCESGRKRGLPMTGCARRVESADLDRFDLILAMDEANLQELLSVATDGNRSKIRRFCDFCARHSDTEVPDPYYGGAKGFEHVLDLLEDGCAQILALIRKRRGNHGG